MKLRLLFLFVLFLSVSARAEDRMFADFPVYGDIYRIQSVHVDRIHKALESVFNSNGLPVRMADLRLSDAFAVLGYSIDSFDREAENLSVSDLQARINYWISKVGTEFLSEFILKTEHNNVYHLLLVDEVKFDAYVDFLESSGVFGSPESNRGLKAVLGYQYFAEGVHTSKKTTVEEWQRLKVLFATSSLTPVIMARRFSVEYFKNPSNRDFFQRIYLHLSKDLLNVLEKYPQYLSNELLFEALIPSGLQFYSFSDFIENAFEYLKARGVDSSTGKRIALEFVLYTLNNPGSLNDRELMDRIIEELSSKGPTCNELLN